MMIIHTCKLKFLGRYKKVSHPPQTKLTKDDIAYLMKNTRYSEDDIKEWFR